MKNKFKIILLSVFAIIGLIPSMVYAAVSTEITVGGEKLEFDYATTSNHNKENTADFKYTNEYPGGLLTLTNYNGGMIEINHIVGTGTVEENPKTLYIKLEGENKIDSVDFAISSNVNFNIIGIGTLTTTAKSLNNDSVKVSIENTDKVKLENNTDNDEEIMETEDKEEIVDRDEKDSNDTLVTVAIISIIILCSLGSVFFITGIRKNLK